MATSALDGAHRVESTRRDSQHEAATASGLATSDWAALGTTAQVVVTDPKRLGSAREAVTEVLDAIDLAASRFRPDSELSLVNAAGGSWVEVSELFAAALRTALDAAAWTGGLVDPTVGNAVIAHGYSTTFAAVPPVGAALTLAPAPAPGWRRIELDETNRRVRVPAGIAIDLGATAKGLAADLAAQAAWAASGCGVLVNLGGDLAVLGEPPVTGWSISVTDDSNLDLPFGGDARQTIALHSGALATSSTSARRWRRGGSIVHHLIDPRVGIPTAGPWRTATVTASTCALANAAATAAIISGPDAVAWLAAQQLHARLVHDDGTVTYVGEWPRPEPFGRTIPEAEVR